MTIRDGVLKAYDLANVCKQGSPAHSYWMGVAHALRQVETVSSNSSVVTDKFFTLPSFIPPDRLSEAGK